MKVWDGMTQQLTPEWLAHSSLARDLKLDDVIATGSGPARVIAVIQWPPAGRIKIEFEFLNPEIGRGQMVLQEDARLELHEPRP